MRWRNVMVCEITQFAADFHWRILVYQCVLQHYKNLQLGWEWVVVGFQWRRKSRNIAKVFQNSTSVSSLKLELVSTCKNQVVFRVCNMDSKDICKGRQRTIVEKKKKKVDPLNVKSVKDLRITLNCSWIEISAGHTPQYLITLVRSSTVCLTNDSCHLSSV